MRVLIIGAGNTGLQLGARLSALHHEVVIVDNGREGVERARESLDALVIEGWGAAPRVLDEAGIRESNLVAAVTGSDEVNILACAYAAAVGVGHKIARVRNTDYFEGWPGEGLRGMGVDRVVCDVEVTAKEIRNVLRLPGTVEVAELLGGRLIVVGIRVRSGSPLAGRRLEELPRFGEPSQKFRLVGVVRGDEAFVPHGRTLVTTGDVVYLAVNTRDVDEVLDWVQPSRRRGSRVIIVGGGAVGRRLAALLQPEMEVVLVERDRTQAERCSAECRGVTVVHGDCLEEETLREAAPDDQTGFAAVTGDDENNIIACLLARRLGIGLTVARISRQHYSPVISTLEIVDRVVNDHSALLNAIMGYVRGGHVRASRSLDGFPGEILEIAVEKKSRWEGRRLESAALPQGAIVAALQRGEEIIIPTGQTRLTAGDVMVIFSSPEAVARIRP